MDILAELIYELSQNKLCKVSSGCLDFQDHNHQLKSNFMKNVYNLFCDSCLVKSRQQTIV